ncbi:hypothetical protein L3X38_036801 [Prunus dulcis]|uniref:Uncharacterized protein n=1 Tax=Prunus dulcis TaxID=3755 RepID=A0AAD4YQ34_PRUDU|nr:hypothetical protein L3X38_036801 [Prunus dulcis]
MPGYRKPTAIVSIRLGHNGGSELGLNSIPTLIHSTPLSIFADVVDLGAMGVVMVEDVIIFLQSRPALHAFGDCSVSSMALCCCGFHCFMV